MSLQGLAEALADAISRTGELAPLILFVATLVEYVFPPFPGDLIVVLGAWYAVEGAISWPVALVSVTLGAVAGAWIDYRIGAAIGLPLSGGTSAALWNALLLAAGALIAQNLAELVLLVEQYTRVAWMTLAAAAIAGAAVLV